MKGGIVVLVAYAFATSLVCAQQQPPGNTNTVVRGQSAMQPTITHESQPAPVAQPLSPTPLKPIRPEVTYSGLLPEIAHGENPLRRSSKTTNLVDETREWRRYEDFNSDYTKRTPPGIVLFAIKF
jgi:hypothetical protein